MSAGELERRISAQRAEVVAILLAARDGEDAGADHVCVRVRHAARIAPIGDEARQPLGDPSRRSAWDRSITPPSDDKRPPSKAAVIFLRPTAGNGNVAVVSSGMAGVAALKGVQDRLQQPNPTLLQMLKLHPPALSSRLVHKSG